MCEFCNEKINNQEVNFNGNEKVKIKKENDDNVVNIKLETKETT